jgi:DNA repair exonuclease SbcCD ATPase subunit
MVVEIPDDDAPPPGWDQWVNLPMPSPEPQEEGALVRRWDGHMVVGGRGHGTEASSSRAGRSASGEGRVDEPPAFADAHEEQELWGELRDYGASLNRALNEALRIHGGPAWRVFQVRRSCPFSLISSFLCLFLAARRLPVLIFWRQELEHRARDKYSAFDQMSAELRHLWEQRDAFDALGDALGTPDGWLSYRAEALRDQPLEYEGQAAAHPSTLERIRTALIDRDEALQQAQGDMEKVRIVASNWEAEVVTVRSDNRELRTWFQEAQAQQSRAKERARVAEQKAKEANELKAALDAKVAALVTAEHQLQQERVARQGAEGQLQQERTALADARSALERERTAREMAQKSLEERDADVSKLEGELIALSIENADQELSLKEQGATVVSLQQAVEAERRALEVEKKQVEGRSLVSLFVSLILPSRVCSPSDLS